MDEIIKKIYEIKKQNDSLKIGKRRFLRRTVKLAEESGEVSQAVFSVTSDTNSKNKTYDDVREELTDTILVSLEMLLSAFPGESTKDYDEILKIMIKEFERKLTKWEEDKDEE